MWSVRLIARQLWARLVSLCSVSPGTLPRISQDRKVSSKQDSRSAACEIRQALTRTTGPAQAPCMYSRRYFESYHPSDWSRVCRSRVEGCGKSGLEWKGRLYEYVCTCMRMLLTHTRAHLHICIRAQTHNYAIIMLFRIESYRTAPYV